MTKVHKEDSMKISRERREIILDKHKQLIHILSKEGQLTARQLAARLQVSVRTIKNYVQQVNQDHPDTILSSNKGYQLNNEKKFKPDEIENMTMLPQTSAERSAFIIKLLLKSHTSEQFNIYDIAEQLYVSESTLKNVLRKVKRALKDFDLELTLHGDKFQLLGREQNKRRMLSSTIYEESSPNFININSLKASFPETDLHAIRSIVQLIFQEHHYFINDFSLTNLVLHIALSIERIKDSNHHIQQQILTENKIADYHIALKITNRLEEEFQVAFSHAEVYEIALLIAARATALNFETITSENIESFVGKECVKMTRQLIEKINNLYAIDLSQPEFLVRFTLHLYNLMIRSQNNYLSKNPLAQEIKIKYPLIYDMAVNLAEDLTTDFQITMNDDEIAFIAFHIGSVLEMQKENQGKLATVIYCPQYYDMGITLSNQIRSLYDTDLLIKNIVTDFEEIQKLSGIDLIITTVPLGTFISIPSFEVNLLLSQVFKDKLDNKIIELQKQKEKAETRRLLSQLLIPDLFQNQLSFSTSRDCIHYMVDKLIQKGYVSPEFEEEVLSREELSSTAFGYFAIPHSMKMEASKTGLNIILSPTPIPWGNHKVQLVLMMCFNKDERFIFKQVYEIITLVLSNPDNASSILKSQDYSNFIERLVNCI